MTVKELLDILKEVPTSTDIIFTDSDGDSVVPQISKVLYEKEPQIVTPYVRISLLWD
jgi:hypothetical protein